MVYLVIKELSGIAQDVIMATSSLTKDMNDKVAAEIGYRSNAIRALCTITDVRSAVSFTSDDGTTCIIRHAHALTRP